MNLKCVVLSMCSMLEITAVQNVQLLYLTLCNLITHLDFDWLVGSHGDF